MNNVKIELGPPNIGTCLPCMICAQDKPWGVWDAGTGAAVCKECRDKARAHVPPPASSSLRERVEKLTRYDEFSDGVSEHDTGDYVKRADVLAVLGEEEQQRDEWQAYAGYLRSCAIIGESDPERFEQFRADRLAALGIKEQQHD